LTRFNKTGRAKPVFSATFFAAFWQKMADFATIFHQKMASKQPLIQITLLFAVHVPRQFRKEIN